MKTKSHTLLILWLGALILGGWWISQQTKLRSDLSLFLPDGDSFEQQFLLSELHQGYATRILLMAISGGDAFQRANLSQSLLGTLRQGDLFKRVENGTPSNFEIDSRLFDYRYLLNPEATFSQDSLSNALQTRLKELQSPIPSPFKSLLPRDPTSAYAAMLSQWQSQKHVKRSEGVWASRKGDMAILLAETRGNGLSIEQNQSMLKQIRVAFEQLDTSGQYELIISGPGAFSVQAKNIIERESRLLSLFATLAIATLLFLAYRYIPYLLYAALPLFSAVLISIVVTSWIFDELHGITLAFGITLLGVTLDYPVHLFSHIQDREHPVDAMMRIWRTLGLGVITTCLGYLVLITTAFEGLKQLGIFTLIGLMTAALSSRYLLPHLYTKSFIPPQHRGAALVSLLANRHHRLPITLILASIVIILWSMLSSRDLWNDDIAVLSPLPASLITQDRDLRKQLEANETNQMILIKGSDMEQLLQRCESLKQVIQTAMEDQLLGGATLLCDYLPSQQLQRQRQSRLPEPDLLTQRVQQSLEGLPFRPDAFAPFVKDIKASRSLSPLTYEMTKDTLLLDRLAPFIRQTTDGWLALAPLQHVIDSDALSYRLNKGLPGVQYFNLRKETSRLIGDFRNEVIQHVLLGVCLMLVILWVGLRSLRQAIATLSPIALAILLTISLLRLTGEAMNLFHLISLMLVLGIGIDYSLFFSRKPHDQIERNSTLHALGVCALSTISVFTILATSSIPVLHAIGVTVATGVSMSFLTTYTFSISASAPKAAIHR
ncbi:MAG: MMPL family transporter [Candidatus Thiodiazotropha sp. (ex Monitilora ramsayi)]|nr:MMPL family transporter [Candidatus Thiodiazotropha sp. (ex Monitilora ramsayi)]